MSKHHKHHGSAHPVKYVRYNTYFGNDEYYTPLPLRDLQDPGPDRDSAPLLDCLRSGMTLCGRQFSGPGFRLCVYGMLTGSAMLPTGVQQCVGQDVLATQGAYAEGLRLACPTADPSLWRS